jgi:DNA repair protein RadD
MALELRQYQKDAVSAFFSGVESGKVSGIISAPTGSGKSLMIADICKQMITNWSHTRIIVATHKKELIEQDEEEFKRYYPRASTGVYSAGLNKRNTDRKVIFCGIQSVAKRAFDFGKIDLLIVDEAHLVNHEDGTSYARFISDLKVANPNLVIVGMSATPYRLDNGLLYEGENRLFDCLYYDIGLSRLIEEGYLSPVTSRGSANKIDLSGVKTTAGDYNKKSLELAADQVELTRSAVDEICKHGKDRNAWLIFASGIRHANHICKEVRSRGISCEVVTGECTNEERARYLSGFKNRQIRCLVNVEILVAGFNAPETDLIALLVATKSAAKYVQSVGRGTRLAPGKENCLLLDFGQNVIRHGPIDAITPTEAKEKGEGTGEPICKECPSCFEIIPAQAHICPACFYEFPQKPKHGAKAYDGAVLSKDEMPLMYHVEEVDAKRHKKSDKPDSMRLDFYVIERKEPISHYITLDHGGYAADKSRKYVQAAGGVASNVDEALKEFIRWKDPVKIWTKMNGKYRNITKFEFPDTSSTQAEIS